MLIVIESFKSKLQMLIAKYENSVLRLLYSLKYDLK